MCILIFTQAKLGVESSLYQLTYAFWTTEATGEKRLRCSEDASGWQVSALPLGYNIKLIILKYLFCFAFIIHHELYLRQRGLKILVGTVLQTDVYPTKPLNATTIL